MRGVAAEASPVMSDHNKMVIYQGLCKMMKKMVGEIWSRCMSKVCHDIKVRALEISRQHMLDMVENKYNTLHFMI